MLMMIALGQQIPPLPVVVLQAEISLNPSGALDDVPVSLGTPGVGRTVICRVEEDKEKIKRDAPPIGRRIESATYRKSPTTSCKLC